eukprot:Phypoly_transcript_09244.p1 GENE.Phypoly_transcript_09244~~Phypoly_transcript_09244.p1  ORF type:complete len:166 (+),score=10.64 Phypoly_transcript_09244:322-819(+)
MRSFPLPLADNSTDDLKPHAVLSFGSGISTIPAYFDSNDACAFSIVGRQLHLVDLGTFSTLHSVKLLQGTRKTASSVVYNNKEKRVTSFITSARNGANGVAYQLKVLEFQVRGGRLELVFIFSFSFSSFFSFLFFFFSFLLSFLFFLFLSSSLPPEMGLTGLRIS